MMDVTTTEELAEFRARHHTFTYRTRCGGMATSRLDRWYVTRDSYAGVQSVTVTPPVCHSDHDGVTLRIQSTQGAQIKRSGRRSIRYPLPHYAVDAVHAEGRRLLAVHGEELLDHDPMAAATGWDELKTVIRAASLRIQRERGAAATRRYRTRMKRLHHSLRRARIAASTPMSDLPATVAGITAGVEALALDAVERVQRIRRQLIAVKMAGAASCRRRRYASFAGPSHMTARAFYKRISIKFRTRNAGSLPHVPGSKLSGAERLAQDWRPIIQQQPLDARAQDDCFRLLPQRAHDHDFSALAAPFSVEEVAEAIKRCPRGKACGPDGLPNDWYREMGEAAAVILAPLYTMWLAAGLLPVSFGGATVFCIPKTSSPATGLDYRPITLLNSDYKIYARVLLNRIRSHVAQLAPLTQFGFVPGRQVHDAIDVWTAVQHRVSQGHAPETTTAILLDFAKAYDTLDRRFLSLALAHVGFPPAFVAAVDAMHIATTAQFLADGELSSVHDVTAGIRQRCPLAPTLFILAVTVLYDLVGSNDVLRGVSLSDAVRVTLVGFADDTTAYVTTAEEAGELKRLLQQFGNASGLKVNLTKSKAVCASTVQPPAGFDVGFQMLETDELFRYLGAMISSRKTPRWVWDTAITQLTARLHLAAIKTTNILQRIQVAKTIIIPKLLFVARHCWPNREQTERLQRYIHLYVWLGSTSPITSGRAWMSRDAAAGCTADGGLEVPSIHVELMMLSLRTVEHWLSADSVVGQAVAQVLLSTAPDRSGSSTCFAPGRGRVTTVGLRHTLAATGTSLLRHQQATTQTAAELALSRDLRKTAGVGSSRAIWWVDEWLHRDYASLSDQLRTLRDHQLATYGDLNAHGLRHAQLLEHGLVYGAHDAPLTALQLPGLRVRHARVMDVVEWQWVAQGQVRFRYCSGAIRTPQAARSFRLLCDLLVFNYPGILHARDPHDVLRPVQGSETVWRLRVEDARQFLTQDTGPGEVRLEVVRTVKAANRVASAKEGARVRFRAHPGLSWNVPLWDSTIHPTRKALRRLLASTQIHKATAEAQARRRRAEAEHAELARALDTISWKTIHSLPDTSSAQRLLLHRIKGLRLPRWDRKHNTIGCPHCPRARKAGSTMSHIMWECPRAQQIWTQLLAYWRSLGCWNSIETTRDASFRDAVFSLTLPVVPPLVWTLPALSTLSRTDPRATTEVYPTANSVWQLHVLSSFQVINQWRNGLHDAEIAWDAAQALARHASALRATLRQQLHAHSHRHPSDHPGAAVLGELYGKGTAPVLTTAPSALPNPEQGKGRYILFFDGGSRGNPGPGGSGAVIVATDLHASSAEIIWSASISQQRATTTNNQAEYQGVICGLHAATQAGWTPLKVVGDSLLILRQLRHHRPPRSHKLFPLYARATRLADALGVERWHHHLRAFNKMADMAANVAMDTRSSIQVSHPTMRVDHLGLLDHLSGDFSHWQTSTPIA